MRKMHHIEATMTQLAGAQLYRPGKQALVQRRELRLYRVCFESIVETGK